MVERSHTDLFPAEQLALTASLGRILRGDDPLPNTAAMCVLALARITGQHDWTKEAPNMHQQMAGDAAIPVLQGAFDALSDEQYCGSAAAVGEGPEVPPSVARSGSATEGPAPISTTDEERG